MVGWMGRGGGGGLPGFEGAGGLEVVELEKDITACYFGEGEGGDERGLDPWLGEVGSGGCLGAHCELVLVGDVCVCSVGEIVEIWIVALCQGQDGVLRGNME